MLQRMWHWSVTEQTVVFVSFILQFLFLLFWCWWFAFSVDDSSCLRANKLHWRSMFWGYLEERSDQNLNGKAFGSSFIPATGTPFCKCWRQQACFEACAETHFHNRPSGPDRAELLFVILFSILTSFKRCFCSSREESISFLPLKEQNFQALPP